MSKSNTKRGRPKGSGIDDSSVLQAIANAIAADDNLKPTTAIRGLGITDPSTIRRLRDKFKKNRETLLAQKNTQKINQPISRQKKVSRRRHPNPCTRKPDPIINEPNFAYPLMTSTISRTNSLTPIDIGQLSIKHFIDPWITTTTTFLASAATAHINMVSNANSLPRLATTLAHQTTLTTWIMAINLTPQCRYPFTQKSAI